MSTEAALPSQPVSADAARPEAGPVVAASQRLMSVDALRGFDMFWIIGADYLVDALKKISDSGPLHLIAEQLEHKKWEGIAFEDLIFPLFVFIAGVSIVFSLSKAVEQGGKAAAMKRLALRALTLYAVGIFYYGGFKKPMTDIRLLGVLQRIALCYLFTGLLFCLFRWRGLLASCIALLVGYYLMMKFIPVPGVGAGSYVEGKNLANYIDEMYLPLRKWDKTHDPEGLLSTLPAIGTCLLGALAGLLLKNSAIPENKKVLWLVCAGVAGIGLGYLWSVDFPIIKKIWTSSYVLVAGGYASILLGIFYLVIDVWKFQKWSMPFIWIGTNSITIYLAEALFPFKELALRFVGGDIKKALGIYGDLTVAIVTLGFTLMLMNFLYRRKIFLRL